MPSYFIRCTAKGILVLSHNFRGNPFKDGNDFPKIMTVLKTVVLNGKKRFMSYEDVVSVGFFACEDPKGIGLNLGDEVPVTITTFPINYDRGGRFKQEFFPNEMNVCWATPDEE
jgi:hypothetical protein